MTLELKSSSQKHSHQAAKVPKAFTCLPGTN